MRSVDKRIAVYNPAHAWENEGRRMQPMAAESEQRAARQDDIFKQDGQQPEGLILTKLDQTLI